MRWMPGVGLGGIDLRVKNLTRVLVVHKHVNLYSICLLFICILVLFLR